MSDWLIYLLKVSVCIGMGTIAYRLFWYQVRSYSFNRYLLLSLLVISFIIPLVNLSWYDSSPIGDYISSYMSSSQAFSGFGESKSWKRVSDFSVNNNRVDWLAWGYAIITLVLYTRLIIQLIKIFLVDKKEISNNDGEKVYGTSYPLPFSFFGSIFIPHWMVSQSNYDYVLIHERQHVKLGHSWDRLIVEFLLVLLWFNPFTHLFKKYLIDAHELEADYASLRENIDPLAYQLSLLDQEVTIASTTFVSYFAWSNTKRRIHMMNQKNTKSKWRYALVVPVTVSMISIFSFDMVNKSTEHMMVNYLPMESINEALFFKGQLISYQDDIPSILPIKSDTENIDISSAFGERKDPFSGEMKHHSGIDIKAKLGTPVIATANGKVVVVMYQPKGYGKQIVLEHAGGIQTRYAQLEEQLIAVGDRVAKGQVIGKVGSSGRSTAPHLHYEVLKDGNRLNPADFIKDYTFAKSNKR